MTLQTPSPAPPTSTSPPPVPTSPAGCKRKHSDAICVTLPSPSPSPSPKRLKLSNERAAPLPTTQPEDGDATSEIWLHGRRIPSLATVWPAHWPMSTASRIKKRNRLVAEAKEAHHAQQAKRAYVLSDEYQAIQKQEKAHHDRVRRELFETLILPIRRREVRDPVLVRQRGTLFSARVAAIATHERLRGDAEAYDKPGAGWEYLDRQAVAAWRGTAGRGKEVRRIRIRVRACVEGGGTGGRTWVLHRVVEIESVWTPKEVRKTLLAAAKGAYVEWVLSRPRAEQQRGGVAALMRKPRAVLVASVGQGQGPGVEVADEVALKAVVERMFAGGTAGTGSGAQGDGEQDLAGVVCVCIKEQAA